MDDIRGLTSIFDASWLFSFGGRFHFCEKFYEYHIQKFVGKFCSTTHRTCPHTTVNLQNLTRRTHASAPPASLGGGTHLPTEIPTLKMICQSSPPGLRATRRTSSLAHQTSSLLPRMGKNSETFSSSGHLLPPLQPLSAVLLQDASNLCHTLFTQFLSRQSFTRWLCTGYGLTLVSCATGTRMWQPSHLFPNQ